MKKTVGFLLLLLLSGGCVNRLDQPDPADGLPRSLTVAEEELILSGTRFGYDLFRRVNDTANQENLVISPFSLFFTLGLPLNGAFGETRDEIQGTLHLGGMNRDEINEVYKSLSDLVFGLDATAGMQLASSLWHRNELSIKEGYVQAIQKHFDSDILGVDPGQSEAADIINEWVRESTSEHIDHIVDVVSRYMVLYLVDAVYYQGRWRYGFNSTQDQETIFYTGEGDTLEVDMMEQEAEMRAYSSDEVQMVDLPYSNGYFTLTLMLPGEPERSIDEFISKYLTEGRVTEWLQSMTETSILLQMPKFDLAQEHDLQSVLGDMGMDGAFDQTADFYNINESEQLYLSEVRHKTILRIGESGTNEAPGVSTTPDRRIQLNRPFVFLLREQHSGLVLLMGKVGDPAK